MPIAKVSSTAGRSESDRHTIDRPSEMSRSTGPRVRGAAGGNTGMREVAIAARRMSVDCVISSGTGPTRSAPEPIAKPKICTPNWTPIASVTTRWMSRAATRFSSASRAGCMNAPKQPLVTAHAMMTG
jgi:hypothetical protein